MPEDEACLRLGRLRPSKSDGRLGYAPFHEPPMGIAGLVRAAVRVWWQGWASGVMKGGMGWGFALGGGSAVDVDIGWLVG